ncbi:MAG: hypothetical protein LLF82_000303 [Dehalococcoides mccartyi]|uniref:hypothetical protein n=1 Tax=Dehalococcoides mccartyi TaxID=61435 RepID=UPI00242CC3DA|nr:hypothetical protein [Dehalococcoides mccartyi]MCF7634837.1 hypothetical protein [Dehalococcoides mccartyi]
MGKLDEAILEGNAFSQPDRLAAQVWFLPLKNIKLSVRANKYKHSKKNIAELLTHLRSEVDELEEALTSDKSEDIKISEATLEAADVSNTIDLISILLYRVREQDYIVGY